MGDRTIGIDIDHKNQMCLLKVYFNSKMIAEPVDVRETKHGFHLRISKRTSIWRQIETRLLLSDCKGRLAFDELKLGMGLLELTDTLFEFKKGKDGVWREEEPVDTKTLLSEPFWSRANGKHRRWMRWQRKLKK